MVVLEIGLVSNGMIDPLSNSPETLFITETSANRKNPKLPMPVPVVIT
jgi:hypothetical protein